MATITAQIVMTSTSEQYTIALDFDGTMVEHRYPKIGDEIPGAVENVLKLLRDGHHIILWTVRERELLDEAVQWCQERGITFYAINKNYPEESPDDKHFSRKLKADIFIDDRMIGGVPNWDAIYDAISSGRPHEPLHVTTGISQEHEEMMRTYQSRDGRRGGIFGRWR